MPSTASMISKLERAVSNYSRIQLLDALNEVLTIVYSENMAQTYAIDTTTGQPPLLTTVAGTFEYDLPADCRELVAVVVDNGYPAVSGGDGYGASRINVGNDLIAFNRSWKVIPATSISATYSDVATVTFTNDPGDTTTVYYLLYHKKPSALDTEDDEIPLPEELHYLLRQAVLAMLNTENYGQTGFDNQVFDSAIKTIRNRMNRGSQSRIGRTGVRIEDMNFAPAYSAGYGRRYR